MIDQIRETLEMMRENQLAEFELHRENLTLWLRKAVRSAAAEVAAPAAPVRIAAAPLNGVQVRSEEIGPFLVTSPLVGTFHSAHTPGAPPFIEVGQAVKRGQVLAIVEAIRLTHEIKAGCSGSIVKVSAREGQAVQYGEHLFEIQPE
jgi:acetyl-CoA carboxylase biotin carboxyl carrier protein